MTAQPEHTADPTPPASARRPRRAPSAADRRRDAERSRQALLDAALDEFAAKGFDGARVQEIADRAGVNKQLIAYYFGGKEGLYQEIQRGWPAAEAERADPELPLDEIAARYLTAVLEDPRPARLLVWRGLTGSGTDSDYLEGSGTVAADLANLARAQERGEIAGELDPAFVRMAVMGMILAPVMLPETALQATGKEPGSKEFEEYYGAQLRTLIRLLGR
ncbi:TetR family transcriptional regulator [Nocardia sp. CDC153]|uniref:TetR/AcrR family transcriptional regulator n=1 Tax=Nocardia sp. CDC153 TaxID=3112167 RepID=UPI002DBCC2C8|nr:TetR family transcriptional regulator [Nocardia sp. CDC153]MEC3952690.1 TetR family transcriptional regulator [Nocardia sp. CDC153]